MTEALKKTMRRQALRVIYLQGAVAACIGLAYLVTLGLYAAWSAWVAGMICVLVNGYFAWRVFTHTGARAADRIVKNFYRGEVVKLLLTALLIFIAIKWLGIAPLPFFVSFAFTQLAFWFVLVVFKPESEQIRE